MMHCSTGLKMLHGFEGCSITDFTTSWKDGIAFSALISAYRPDLIDYDSLPNKHLDRLEISFTAAEKAGVKMILEAKEVVDFADRKCIVSQLKMYYNKFGMQTPSGSRK